MTANYNTTLVPTLLLLTFLCLLLPQALQAQIPATEFIRSKCNSTEYPQLCFDSLSSYGPTINNSPVQLATAALSITLKSAQSASAMMGRLSISASDKHNGQRMSSKQEEAVSDCTRSLSDSVEYLRQSLKEMERLKAAAGSKKEEVEARVSNVQTWVSTALTDESSCMDAFGPGGKIEGVKGAVKGEVVKVTQLTCNALALIAGVATSA